MPVPPSVIIGIHGLANKPPSVDKPGYWKKALIEGLKRNCGKTTNDLSFDFVYWADLRYPTPIAYSDNPEYYYEDPGVGPFPDYHTNKWAEIIKHGNRNCWNGSKFSRCAHWRDESRRVRFGTRAPGSGCILCRRRVS